MLLQTVLLFHTFQLMPSCQGHVFLEQPGPGPIVAPIGTQVQLRCSVMKGYWIQWEVTQADAQFSTDLPGVLDTLRARGIVMESPDDETSLLVINMTKLTNETAATCIAINRNNLLAREESRQVQILFFVFLEQPGPGPIVATIGTQVQLNCSVREGYTIEWGVTLPGQTVELATDLPEVLATLRARGIVVESPDDETSQLVINATESTNGTAATCIAINRNSPLAREESRPVQVFYICAAPNLMAIEDASICLVEDITYSIQCSYITGSDARGCVYTLVSGVEGVDNITGIIDRISSQGKQIILPNLGDFVELLIFSWERDNSISSLSMRVNVTQPESCKASIVPTVIIITTVMLVGLPCITIVIIVLTVIFCSRRCQKRCDTTQGNYETNAYKRKTTKDAHKSEAKASTEDNLSYQLSDNQAQSEECETLSEIESVDNDYYLHQYAEVGTVGAPKVPKKSGTLEKYLKTAPVPLKKVT